MKKLEFNNLPEILDWIREPSSSADRKYHVHDDERWPDGHLGRLAGFEPSNNQVPKENQQD